MDTLEEEEKAVISIFAPSSFHRENQVFDTDSEEERLAVDTTLAKAEDAFLKSTEVQRPNVPLKKLAARFSKARIPEAPIFKDKAVENYVKDFVENTVNDSINTSSPNMIGHMTSSLPYFVRPLSRLVTTLNQNAVKTETAKTITFLEREAMAQLHQQIFNCDESFYKKWSQEPSEVLGSFTSGGTLANITALWAARNSALPAGIINGRNFGGVEQEGLFAALDAYGYKGAVIIGSELLHYSMAKAADILGMGTNGLASVPYDESYRIKVIELEALIQKYRSMQYCIIAILGVAGATETGSIDPLDELATLASQYKIHFHVDAAWGGPLIFSKKMKTLLSGIQNADTVTLDGHKQLYMPMGCGLCFFRDPKMSLSVQKTAQYIIRKDSYDLGKFTLEGSRPANAVYLHSNLNILGIRGYEILVDRSVRMAKYMAEKIKASKEFELLTEPVTNILLYRALPKCYQNYVHEGKPRKIFTSKDNEIIDKLNVELQTRQALGGKTFVSRTAVRSPKLCHSGARVVALRVVIANPLTFEADLDRVLHDQRIILEEVETKRETTDALDAMSEVSMEESPLLISKRRTSSIHLSKMDLEQDDIDATAEKAYKKWEDYWDEMPIEVKMILKNDKTRFLETLVAPELGVSDEDGLFSLKETVCDVQPGDSSQSG